ncbi:hypothetical protein H1V43_02730 [Streptomyces sp. PSKA54]|uniref:Uncharacterized protein n=1 Tax=Streptomyces himalayensis subsp. aureolus TaxID=2758039 RepID=A0A7W2CWD4_9ACTN|nr:hypothetical protein [Streptomyces himalayensis]MBA4860315.1 hypothetical protein [Streptomyces himalayensis subsp. aureolus]
MVGAGTLINAAASYGQLALVGRALGQEAGDSFSVFWAIVFSVGIGLFFPLEQELTRAIADRHARAVGTTPLVRRGAAGTLGLACATLGLLTLGSSPLADALFAGERSLVSALGGALLGLACAHLTRGVLAGLGVFSGYGAQLALDAVLRLALTGALTAAGNSSPLAYALVLTAAPVLASLAVLPTALRRATPGPRPLPGEIGAGAGALIISTLLTQVAANAPVITVRLLAPDRAALASALLYGLVLVRIPQFLVASLQASLLVRLTHAHTRRDPAGFRRALLTCVALVTGVASGWMLLCALLGPMANVALFAAEPLLDTADFVLLALGSTGFLLALVLGNAAVAAGRRGAQVLAWSWASCLLLALPAFTDDALWGAELAFAAAAWAATLVLLLSFRSLLGSDAQEFSVMSDTPPRSPADAPTAATGASSPQRLVGGERRGRMRLSGAAGSRQGLHVQTVRSGGGLVAATKVRALWSRVPPALRLPLAVFLVCQACYLLWWAAFYPGVITKDSVVYIWQVTTGHWRSDHSALYSSLVWFSLKSTGDLWALTLLQAIAMSAVLAYACASLRTLGVRGRWSAPAAVACAAAPSLGSFTVFVWKDVPFTICAVLVFAVAAQLVGRRVHSTWNGRLRRSELLLLGIGFLGLGLFRNNGFPVSVVASLALLLALPGARRLIAALAAATTALTLSLMLVIYPAAGIERPSKTFVYNLHYADLAVTYSRQPGLFTADDLRLMAQVAPLSHWRGPGANCYAADPFYYNPALDKAAAERLTEPLVRLWWRTLHKAPQQILEARMCRAHIAWAVFPGPRDQGARTWTNGTVIPANLWGFAEWDSGLKDSPYLPVIKTRPLSQDLNDAADFSRYAFHVPQLEWLFWRGATWSYATYVLIALLTRARRCRALLALSGVTLGVQLTVLAANPAPCFRYMAAPMFIGVLCLSLIPALQAPVGGVVPPRASRALPSTTSTNHVEHVP